MHSDMKRLFSSNPNLQVLYELQVEIAKYLYLKDIEDCPPCERPGNQNLPSNAALNTFIQNSKQRNSFQAHYKQKLSYSNLS